MVRSNVNNSVGVTDFMQIPEKKERKNREIAIRMNLKKKMEILFSSICYAFPVPSSAFEKTTNKSTKVTFGQTVPL